MSPERFRLIEELFHAAREGTPGEQAALLARTDPELRREVESLLLQAGNEEFLEQPAIQNAPDVPAQDAMEHTTELAGGACLGPYRIESKLGAGGMGQVFRAVDTRLGRAVAVKIAHEHFSSRFEREARAIASLNHPNICTVHDVGPNYLVMELIEGESMAERLKHGPIPLSTALLYASHIAAALAEAHAKGIVHRDLKPGNIMIAKSGAKVLDFGLARSRQDETVTAAATAMGTPAYMAPEQRQGTVADVRADIYSFGCVLYEMCTGSRVSARSGRLPSRKLEAVVTRCLEHDPCRRWQSVAELERELARVGSDGTRGKRLAAAAGMLALFSVLSYFYFHRVPKLTEKDTIVLADFENKTGDPVFDGALRQGLAIQLEQSPFLKIMDDAQVQRELRLMSLPAGVPITNQTAHEVCVRDGAAATIDGSIASLGKSYAITLQAINCQAGATLAREQVQADDKEHVLRAIGVAATAMRARLGESLSSIEKLNLPLEQATTSSLAALQSFTAGYGQLSQGHFLPAVPLLEHATALDPKFATAYYYLGIALNNAGDVKSQTKYYAKAFAMIDRVSEFERDTISAGYYEVTGQLDKAVESERLGIENYPRNFVFHNGLSNDLIELGQFEEGLREGQTAVRLQSNVEPPYRRVLDAFLCLDRLDEARKVAEKLRILGIDGARIHQRFLEMAYVEDDRAAIARETQWFAGRPEEYLSFGLQAAYRNVHGQRRESGKLYKRAAETALHRGLRDVAAGFDEAEARAGALAGNCRTADRLGRPALALAMCGDTTGAERLAAQTSKLFPNGTLWNAVQLPEVRAAIEFQRDRPAKALELLTSAAPYERAHPDAIYIRGLAYLRLHKGAEAVAEFRKIVDRKGASWGSTWLYPNWGQYYSLSYLGMGRGSALAGDTVNAKRAFGEFFALWKDADPDIPALQQAKAEYARLP